MKKPHVQSLHYRAEPTNEVRYENPPPISVTTPEFTAILQTGHLAAQMRLHYATEGDARVPLDAFVRAWEISAGLRRGRAELRFIFDRSEIIDLEPPLPGEIQLHGSVGGRLSISGELTVLINSPAYPAPPIDFIAMSLVEVLWRRYEGFVAGSEPLFAVSYYCLTKIETDAGDRRRAARTFNIDFKVLSKIGELSSERGDDTNARKARHNSHPATDSEVKWLQAAIPLVIRQVGSVSSGRLTPVLTMGNLPAL